MLVFQRVYLSLTKIYGSRFYEHQRRQNFLRKEVRKDEILKFFLEKINMSVLISCLFLDLFLPVNKANAVKSGIISAKDLPNTVDQITIDYRRGNMFKANYILMDILANFIETSYQFLSGGIYDDENIFYLKEYLQFDGFSYRLVPIKTEEREDGEMGRVDAEDLYKIVKNYKWGNFKI